MEEAREMLGELMQAIDETEAILDDTHSKDEKYSQRVKDHYESVLKNFSEIFA